jgi:hypothetical protein
VYPFFINPHEIDMSADKDRGIRRQKQKRAKALKRQAKQRAPVGSETQHAISPAPQAAA